MRERENMTGWRGTKYRRKDKRFEAYIRHPETQKKVYCGGSVRAEEAHEKYLQMELKLYGYHRETTPRTWGSEKQENRKTKNA